jgi:hypothetical protein
MPDLSPNVRATTRRSKTLAAWLALLLGAFGVHRWYLRGAGDPWAWFFLLPSLAGAAGILRMRNISMEDPWSGLLVPLLGLSLSAAMLSAIVIALTTDDKWAQAHNPTQGVGPPAGWGAVMAAIIGLLLGGTVFMGTVAFAGQKFFEWERARDEAAAALTNNVKTTRD